MTSPNFIPDSQFAPDAPAPSGRVPAGDEDKNPSFIPDHEFIPDSEKYGSASQSVLAAVEGAARGATLGTSDFLASKISSPEAVRAREEENPVASLGGNVLGGAGLLAVTGGAAAPIEGALLGAKGVQTGLTAARIGARVAGMASEGAVLGAGNAVSDYALGDPDLNAQKVMAHIGMGAALGGGLGLLSKGIEAAPALLRTSEAAKSAEVPEPIVDTPMTGVQPTTYEDMAKKVEQATKFGGQTTELPAKGVLEDAASRIDMMNPVHPLQLESLESQAARDRYGIAREMKGKEGDAIRGYEAIQKNELLSKTDRAIEDLSPGLKPTPDAVEGGNRSSKAFTDQYQAEKSELAPAFKQLKEMSAGVNVDHLPGVIERFTDAVPGVARMFNTETGAIDKVLPYSTKWGIDRATYNAVKEAVSALADNPESLEDLANIRKGLSQHVDVLAQGEAPGQIRALKAAMMNYMQDVVDTQAGDDMALRGIFKRYAINEQERSVVEKAFGASVGSAEFGALSKVKPELINDKIFSNTANVKAAKAILDPKAFNESLANWLAEARSAATDKGAFNSNKFGTFLKKNQDALNEAFKDNPAALQRLRDVNTMMRILPDAASVNPSGTAKTILGHLSEAHGVGGVLSKAMHMARDAFEQHELRAEVAAGLAGKADQAAKLKSIDGIVKRTAKRIQSGAKDVFEKPASRGAAAVGAGVLTDDEFKKQTDRIRALSRDPHALLDHLSTNTDALYAAAPNITQGVHNAMISGVQFLASKIPGPIDELPMSQEWQVSKSQKFTFENYYRAVNDPISVLDDVKNNSVTNESLEALTVVAPSLLKEMRMEVMGNIDLEAAKSMPFTKKASIAKFLGQPLDQNMLPAAVISSQVALNQPQLSAQNAPQSGRKSTLGGAKQMKLANRVETRTQEERDSEV